MLDIDDTEAPQGQTQGEVFDPAPVEIPPPPRRNILYVTYTESGELDGYYNQFLQPEHEDRYIQLEEPLADFWGMYRANAARDGVELIPPAPPAPPSLGQYSDAVQTHLNMGAQAMGYDSILTAVTYADEPAVPRFQNEGRALRRWRSLVWAHCQELMARVQRGDADYPTIPALLEGLPQVEIDAPGEPAA